MSESRPPTPGRLDRLVLRGTTWITEHPWAVLGALGLAVAASLVALVLRPPGLDNAVEVWFVEGDPELDAYRRFQREFTNDEVAVVAYTDPAGILRAEPVERLRRVSARIGRVQGVREVLGLATVQDVTLKDDALHIERLVPPPEAGRLSPAALEQLRRRVEQEPLIRRHLLDPSGRTTVLIARMEAMQDIDRQRHRVLVEIEGILADELGSRDRWALAGIGVIYDALNVASTRDAGVFMGLALVLILVTLTLVLRKAGPVLLVVGQVSVSSLLAVGLFAAAGRSFNMVSMLLPTLVLIYGILDAIHILSHLGQELGEAGGVPAGRAERRALVARTMAHVARPGLLTSITTAVGFGSLVTAEMSALRDLGLFAGLGVLIDWVVTMTLLGALLPGRWLLPHPAAPVAGDGRSPAVRPGLLARLDVLGHVARALGGLAVRRRVAVLAGAGLVLLIGALGVSRLEVDTYSIGFFPDDHTVRQDSDRIEAGYGFYTPLEFTVTAPGPDGVRAPAVLQGLARWQRAMEQDPAVARTRSLADLVAKLNMVLGDGQPASRVVPDDADRVQQALEFYEADPESERATWATADFRRGRVSASVQMMSAGGIGATTERLLVLARRELPAGVEVRPSGYLPLYVRMMDYVVRSQVSSFAVAFGVVFLLIGVMFRSARVVALSVLPNLLPIFVTLGGMGWVGIRLDVATVTIAPIAIGLAVDNTIYFFHQYLGVRRGGGGVDDAVLGTIAGAGRAMLASSLILALGFGVLSFATVRSVLYMGLLTAVSVVAALLGDLLVLPAQLAVLERRGR